MIPHIGVTLLWFAIGMAACALIGALPVPPVDRKQRDRVSSWLRRARSAGPAMLVLAALSVVAASGTFIAALLRHEFGLRYVAEWTSTLVPARELAAAVAASDIGVRVLWSAALALVSGTLAAVHIVAPRRTPPAPTLIALLAAVLIAALVSLVVGPSPFAVLPTWPLDGRGLPPTLRTIHAVVQPPLQLLGLALALVPLAHVAAAVIDGRSVARWRVDAARALVCAWIVQTCAVVLGLWWAQQQAGWFGLWFTWTPWASAPLLPWLATTVAMTLITLSPTRSATTGDDTRELLAAGAIAFASCLAAFAAWQLRVGTAASVAMTSSSAIVPARTTAVALAALALGLTAVVALAWRDVRAGRAHASGIRRVAPWLAALGALCVAVGIGASHWRSESTAALEMGTPHTLRDPFGAAWTATSQGMSSYREATHTVLGVAVTLAKGGERGGLLTTEQRQFLGFDGEPVFEPITNVAQRHGFRATVTAVFDRPMSREVTAVRIGFVPLAWLPFAGALLLCLAVPAVAWPQSPSSPDRDSYTMSNPHDDPAEAAIARARARQRACSVHGPRPEPDARFCSECGAALEGVCASCGTPAADATARYCAECGAAFVR